MLTNIFGYLVCIHLQLTVATQIVRPIALYISLLEFSDPGPAFEGVTVNFTCAPGMILTGPNSTTCTESGLWEPDPRDTQCRPRSPGKDTNNISTKVYIKHNCMIILCRMEVCFSSS